LFCRPQKKEITLHLEIGLVYQVKSMDRVLNLGNKKRGLDDMDGSIKVGM
jgi:hypothetical protein